MIFCYDKNMSLYYARFAILCGEEDKVYEQKKNSQSDL